MTERTMRGLLRYAATCAPLLTLVPSFASAQAATQAIDPNFVVKRGTTVVENGSLVYTSISDCSADVKFTFSAKYPMNVPVVEAWLGVGETEDCTLLANRTRMQANILETVCTPLGSVKTNTLEPTITVAGNVLFDQDGNGCDSVSGTPRYTVYFLPLQQETTVSSGVAPSVIGTMSTLKASFSPFTVRPAAPTKVSGQSGESQLVISYDSPSSAVPLTEYRAYFDIETGSGGSPAPGVGTGDLDGGLLDASLGSAGDSGTSDSTSGDGGTEPGSTVSCGSGRLRGGEPAPVNASGIIRTGKSNSKSAKLPNPSSVPLGATIAAAVVSVDPAGNESVLSTPVCIERKETDGFLDLCRVRGDCDLGSCSLDPTAKSSAVGLSMFLLAVAAFIRRRGRA